jgi:heptosyltransferase-2/heptosyltransferase-3
VLIGAGHETGFNQDIIRLCGVTDVHNVADDLPVPRLLALLAEADSLLSVDSGPAHAAVAVGCPVVDLFGKASVDEYRPRGASGAEAICLSGVVNGQPDMLGIRVDTVLDAWRRLRPRQAIAH